MGIGALFWAFWLAKGNTPIWSLLPTAQLLQFNLQWDFHRNIGRSILSSSGSRTEIRNKRRDHRKSQSEIIPLIKIRIQRWIEPKVASWVLLSIHSGGRSPHHATIGYRSADFGWKNIWSDYLCIPSRRCINWARFAANFTHKVNEQYTLKSTQSTYHSPHRKVIGNAFTEGWVGDGGVVPGEAASQMKTCLSTEFCRQVELVGLFCILVYGNAYAICRGETLFWYSNQPDKSQAQTKPLSHSAYMASCTLRVFIAVVTTLQIGHCLSIPINSVDPTPILQAAPLNNKEWKMWANYLSLSLIAISEILF